MCPNEMLQSDDAQIRKLVVSFAIAFSGGRRGVRGMVLIGIIFARQLHYYLSGMKAGAGEGLDYFHGAVDSSQHCRS